MKLPQIDTEGGKGHSLPKNNIKMPKMLLDWP